MLASVSTALLIWALLTATVPDLESVVGPVTLPPVVDPSVEATCTLLANRLASVGRDECLGLGLRPTEGRSVEDVTIVAREYPPLPGREPLGKVLLFGGIHGDELSSVSVVFKWMSVLDQFHSGLFHWKIVPVLNPDGLLQRPAQRVNGRGVDLNRNFPCPDWLAATQDYWIRRTGRNPRRYPGPQPLSEPETQWFAEQVDRWDPDVIVSVHAPLKVIDFDGAPDPPHRLGSLYLKLLGTYPGSLGRWAGVYRETPVLTIELPSATAMPSVAEQREIWVDLIGWLRKTLNPVDDREADMEDAPPAASQPAGMP